MNITDAGLYFLPAPMRVPLKFGSQVMSEVTCARVCLSVRDDGGATAEGWGESPLNVGWLWPSDIDYHERDRTLQAFCAELARDFKSCDLSGHAMDIGFDYQRTRLGAVRDSFNADHTLPYLAALGCLAAFDLALHDAYGRLHGRFVYDTYNADFMPRDLSAFLESDDEVSFADAYPSDFLKPRENQLPVWHLVGGLDPIDETELTGDEPDDGYPVLLRDWIRRDGLNCLKVKLRGNDAAWDYERLARVGRMAREEGVEWLTADFNCTVKDPVYVTDCLDRLAADDPATLEQLLYIEQPFPHDLEAHPIDAHAVSERKPLFLDESAHDWTYVRLGRRLGWNGVALKTCKTQTGALLSLCWARAHGMQLMVQDLTNPMLAQIPHVLLAAYAGTIMGVESNGMQFYPDASLPEQAVHPRVYRRREGILDLSTIDGPGFGYRLDEMERTLPEVSVL